MSRRTGYSLAPAYPPRKRARRTRPPSRWDVYGGFGKQLFKDVMYLKSLINSEPHYHIVQSSNNFSWNGVVVNLSDIPQGDGVTSRTGDRCLPRFLNINLNVGAASSFAATFLTVRMIVFRYWGEATSGTLTVTADEILSTTGTQYAPLSHLDPDNCGPRGDRQRRIEVLKSELMIFDTTGTGRSRAMSLDLEMNGMAVNQKEHIQFLDASTDDPVSGGCYVLFISDNTNGVYAYYTLESKLVFYDN